MGGFLGPPFPLGPTVPTVPARGELGGHRDSSGVFSPIPPPAECSSAAWCSRLRPFWERRRSSWEKLIWIWSLGVIFPISHVSFDCLILAPHPLGLQISMCACESILSCLDLTVSTPSLSPTPTSQPEQDGGPGRKTRSLGPPLTACPFRLIRHIPVVSFSSWPRLHVGDLRPPTHAAHHAISSSPWVFCSCCL